MRENKQEHPCRLIDISAGGAAVRPMSSVTLVHRRTMVAFFDHIGGIEGAVAREFEGGFAFKLAATQHKREKLAATLTWLANRSELDGAEERRHERITPNSGRQHLQLAEGITIDCEVLDISRLWGVHRHRRRGQKSAPKLRSASCGRGSSATTTKVSASSSSTRKIRRHCGGISS